MTNKEALEKIKIFREFLIKQSKEADEILIIGDYDVDGICSCLELKPCLEVETGKKVNVIIPDRYTDGYGIPDIAKTKAIKKGVQVITIDNGIEQNEKISMIYQKTGIKPFIIDHHIYDRANMTDDCYYLDFHERNREAIDVVPDYCGSGLAFEIAKDTFVNNPERLKERNRLFILATLGTIADCVKVKNPADRNGKIILEGFNCIKNADIGNLDMQMGLFLDDCGALDRDYITTDFLQFKVNPVINALGRIAPEGGMRVFNILDHGTAEELEEMFNANSVRIKIIDDAMNDQSIIAQIKDGQPNVIYAENLCEGCCGLIASRIAEKTKAPCLVCTDKAMVDGKLTGSGRNVEGWENLYNCLEKVNAESFKFGGHEMACGFSFNKEDLEKVQNSFTSEHIYTPQKTFTDIAKFDSPESLYALEPFGADNPQPMVCVHGKVENKKILGKNPNMASFPISKNIKAITFTKGTEFESGDMVSIEGVISINEYHSNHCDNVSLQVNIKDIQKERSLELLEEMESDERC